MTLTSFRRSRAKYIAAALGLYVIFLFAAIPSTWLSWGLSRASHGAVHLYRSDGTLWRGTGELAIAVGQGDAVHFGRIKWRITPLRLLIGQVKIRLRPVDLADPTRVTLTIGIGKITLHEVSAAVPARLAALVYPPIALITPSGQAQISAKAVELTRENFRGEVAIVWQNAGSRFPNISGLGDYRLAISGKGDTASIALSTVRGDLALSGQGQWQIRGNGDLQLNGNIKPTARIGELEPLLQKLGPDRGGGLRTFSLKTRLPLTRLIGG